MCNLKFSSRIKRHISSEIHFNIFELTCQKYNFQCVINIKKLMNIYFTFFSIKSLKSGTHVTLTALLMGKPRLRWLLHQTARRMGRQAALGHQLLRVFKPQLTAHLGALTDDSRRVRGGPYILSGTFQSPSDRDWPTT